MANFDFLKDSKQYTLFADAAAEAEKVLASSPAMCAIGCRKALELAVKWVYTVDTTLKTPYKDNLSARIHEYTFKNQLDSMLFAKVRNIVHFGNLAVHTDRTIPFNIAMTTLKGLFEFIQWIDYSYGSEYQPRQFDEAAVPSEHVDLDIKKIKEQESLLDQKDAELEALRQELAQKAGELSAAKEHNQQTRTIKIEELSEFKTRKLYIDAMLLDMDWELEGPGCNVSQEYEVDGMAGVLGQKGYADYVLWGSNGKPLAVIEAKKACKDPNTGRTQAKLYADCLEKKFGQRPFMFTTNGFDTWFWDDAEGPQRKVSGILARTDLERIMSRRTAKLPLEDIAIDNAITDRYYQKAAIRAVCDEIGQNQRRHLLVMATGTGKTRTAASLTDVLTRANHVTNVLFLADRTALVIQARNDFRKYLPDMSLCNLCSNKDDKSARIVFSTYPTMMNAIDNARTGEGNVLFTPGHFDLIIVDESHRSIFKKYRAIFDYFDAIIVGLTATPKTDVDRNTYEFFDLEDGVPTYAYSYQTAVEQDHVLVPYYNYEVKTKFLSDGITYNDLSDEDKQRYEEDFTEDGAMPDFVPSQALNEFVFNKKTADTVIQDLMERGIKVDSGERIGKTIIFAQNKKHAEFILQRFNALYPQYCGKWASRVVCDDSYAQTVIDDFKVADKTPHIAVSVDMMDTGIDVPECVNLVFFKKIRSRTKFWQMIGRGTRLCPGLECVDSIDGVYTDKRRFLIFDYCENFEYFRQTKNDVPEGVMQVSLSERIFGRRIRLMVKFQNGAFAEDEGCQAWRKELAEICRKQVAALNPELFAVRLVLKEVEKFKTDEAYASLSNQDLQDLEQKVAPLVHFDDPDIMALRFDSFMYGFMLDLLDGTQRVDRDSSTLVKTVRALQKLKNIPQVADQLPLLEQIDCEAFWQNLSASTLEDVRRKLRPLIQFLDRESKAVIITNLYDPVVRSGEGKPLPVMDEFESYEQKVNRYIEEHRDTEAIRKLTQNIPLTQQDYEELERIFTQELGSREQYKKAFSDTPFGLLVRKIAKLDHDAAFDAFSEFINDESLNSRQIEFVKKIILYIEQNGYIDNPSILREPPFDKPFRIFDFDHVHLQRLMHVITSIKQNALWQCA